MMNANEIVRLLQFRAAYNLPIHAGMEQGIFERHGITLQIAYTPGSAYVCESLQEGRCEIGFTAADDIIAAVEQQASSDLIMFMGLHSGLFTLVGAADVKSIDALAGRRIGVDAKDTGFVLVLVKFLRERGLSEADCELVEIGGWERRFAALSEGMISATLLTEPFLSTALAAGCNPLARDREMIPAYQGTVGAVSRRWALGNSPALVSFIRAYVEATEWCFSIAHRQACLHILERHNDIAGDAAAATLAALLDPTRGLYPRAALSVVGVRAALELRAELGYLASAVPPVDKYCDLSFYERASTAAK